MCGRFNFLTHMEELRGRFGIKKFDFEVNPRYNIAPSQKIATIIQDDEIKLVGMRWGLIPFWSKEPKSGPINARSETVMEKPTFKAPFKQRRCLIPADGFYEWQKKKEGPKQPYYIHMKDKKPFALAGIWDIWKNPDGGKIESCSILTTEPNEVVKPIHKRMPVIVEPKKFDTWLNTSKENLDEAQALLKPYDAKVMEAYPVNLYVNSPSNKGEKCIEEFQEKYKQQKLF